MVEQLIEKLRELLHSKEFSLRHRIRPNDFTRDRIMILPRVVLFILLKSTRSLQRRLHDFLGCLEHAGEQLKCTPGGWSQARAKLSHRAFIELNDEALIPAAYAAGGADAPRLWHGHRLISFDGSVVRLPKSASVVDRYGLVEAANKAGPTGACHCVGRLSVAYDVLNRLGWDVRLAPTSTGETDLAAAHLDTLKAGDVAVMDRGYTGFGLLACMSARGVGVVSRCSTGSFAAAQELFRRDEDGVSVQVRLQRPPGCVAPGAPGAVLPAELAVRLISVRLKTGELEVLATTLLDENIYPTEAFAALYHLRWGVETFYLMLKSRLELENWSGLTLEAVHQDLAATLLVFNLESLMSRPAQQVLDAPAPGKPARKHTRKVNRAGAYHALKTHAIELLAGDDPPGVVLAKLQEMFLASPVIQRPERQSPRPPPALTRSYHYQRCVKKSVF